MAIEKMARLKHNASDLVFITQTVPGGEISRLHSIRSLIGRDFRKKRRIT